MRNKNATSSGKAKSVIRRDVLADVAREMERQQLTPRDVAGDVGVHHVTISRWFDMDRLESSRGPDVAELVLLCRRLKLDLARIIRRHL